MLIKSLKRYLQEFFRLRLSDSAMSYADTNITLNFCAYGLLGLLLENSAETTKKIKRTPFNKYAGFYPNFSIKTGFMEDFHQKFSHENVRNSGALFIS